MTDKKLRQVNRIAEVVLDRHGARLDEIIETMLERELTDAERSILDIALLFGSMLTSVELLAGMEKVERRRK